MAQTIETYLRSMVDYDISDETIATILFKRAITSGFTIDAVDQKSANLALADLYMRCSIKPTSFTGAQDSDGGWSHKDSTITMSNADRRALIVLANDIYRKYGEPVKADIKLVNLW